jgi:maltose alpha-D-glucosyltransferase/alpha-amylase
MGNSGVIPSSAKARRVLLECFMLERALLEIDHELNHRHDWLTVALRGLLRLLGVEPIIDSYKSAS